MAVPALALLMLAPALRPTPGGADRRQHLDVTGAVLLSVLAAVIIALLHSASADLGPPVLLVMGGVAICAAVAIVFHVRRHLADSSHATLSPHRDCCRGAIVGLTLFTGYYGVLSTAPELLAQHHVPTLRTGLVLPPAALCGVLTGPALAALWRRRQPLWQTTALLGLLTAAAALPAGRHPLPVIVAGAVGWSAGWVMASGRPQWWRYGGSAFIRGSVA